MPALILSLPEGENTTFSVSGAIVSLGRARNNDIRIAESHLSSNHADFRRRADGSYDIVDLGSMNGTYVNGVRITERRQLKDGDCIVFGVIETTFLEARPMVAAEDQPFTRGIEIDLARDEAEVRRNPEIVRTGVDLEKQVIRAMAAPAKPPLAPQVERAVPVDPKEPAKPPVSTPTVQMVTGSRNRPIVVSVQTPTPTPAPVSSKPSGNSPDSFAPAKQVFPQPAPAKVRSPFTVAPHPGPKETGRMPGSRWRAILHMRSHDSDEND